MDPNVGKTDRIARFVLGIIAVIAAFAVGVWSSWGFVLGAIAAVLRLTAAVSFSPNYRQIGISTCARTERQGS